jgi:hypothetical protein
VEKHRSGCPPCSLQRTGLADDMRGGLYRPSVFYSGVTVQGSVDRSWSEAVGERRAVLFLSCDRIPSYRGPSFGDADKIIDKGICPDPLVLGSCVPAVGKDDRQSNQGPYQTASVSLSTLLYECDTSVCTRVIR